MSGSKQRQFVIKSQAAISLHKTIVSHGWVNLQPWVWDRESTVLSRPEVLPSGVVVMVTVHQSGDHQLCVRVQSQDKLDRQDLQIVRQRVKRWLSIDWDCQPAVRVARQVDKKIAAYIDAGGGRFLRGSHFFEDFIKTLCTLNASWQYTIKMVSRLISVLGHGGTFPGPLNIITGGADVLREQVRMGYRAEVVFDLTRLLLEQGIIDERGDADPVAISYEGILNLRGIGPYAAAHTMVLLHDYSRLPIDSEVTSYCKKSLDIEARDVERYFARWGDFKFLGFQLGRSL